MFSGWPLHLSLETLLRCLPRCKLHFERWLHVVFQFSLGLNLRKHGHHCYTCRVLTVSTPPFLRPSIRDAGYTLHILLLESGLKKPCQLLRKHEWLLHWAWHPASLEASPVLSTSSMKRSLGFVSERYFLRHESGLRRTRGRKSMEFLSIISPTTIRETRVVEDLGTNESLQYLVSSFVLLALGIDISDSHR